MANTRIRNKFIGVCACMMLPLVASGCGQNNTDDTMIIVENADNTISYEFAVAEIGDVVSTQKIRCTYRQQNDQEVSFALTGRLVTKVYVEEGDMVEKGDLLAELSAGNLERNIEDLEYKIARNEMLLGFIDENENLDISGKWVNYVYHSGQSEADKEMLDEAIASIQQNYRYQREDSQDALELDRQELANLKQELKYCRVYAEMDGMVYKLKENLESSTSKMDEVVMTIVDNSQCLFEAEAPDFANRFRDGETVDMTITVGAAAGQYVLMPYNISEWENKQLFSVLDGPMTSGIEMGTNGTIMFAEDSKSQVLCVPKTTVNSADGKYYVYVVDGDNMRQVRWVEIGLIGDDSIEIISGLTEGEKVIRK